MGDPFVLPLLLAFLALGATGDTFWEVLRDDLGVMLLVGDEGATEPA